MKLRQQQSEFAYHASLLIQHAHYLGYQVTFGHALRCKECPIGKKHSLHKSKLAIDLNLFDKDGKYLSSTEDHRILGEWWEQQHELACWGGRFNDGNHYSFTRWGRK